MVKGFRHTEVGLIPNDWQFREIDKEIDLLTGFPFPSIHYVNNGIRLLRGSNVKRGVTNWSDDNTKFWSEATFQLKQYLLEEGDIVIAMDGSLVGKSFARLSKSDLPSLLLQRVARVRSNTIDMGYLKEFICSDYFTKHCDTIKTSSAIPHISPKDIRGFKIPIPPIKTEQTAIATALNDADALITALEKLIVKKKAIKQGVMQELLRPKEGWEVKTLGEVAIVRDGTHQTPKYVEQGIPFYSVENVTANDFINTKFISPQEHSFLTKSWKIEKGDILMTRIGSIGVCKYVDWDVNASFYVSLALLKINKEYSAKFIYHYSEFEYFKKEIELNSLQFAYPQKINLGQISQVKLIIPRTKQEQEHIAKIISDLDAEIEALEEKLEKQKQIKQGMMQVLLTGKVRLV